MIRLAALLLTLAWSAPQPSYTLIDLTHDWDGLTSRVTSDDGYRQILIHTRKGGTLEIEMTEETADRLGVQLVKANRGPD